VQHTGCRTVVDPFCGLGTMLAAANARGLDAVGIELCQKRVRRARALTLPSC
jgi:tRNA G10  N-methylase Trm11